MWHDMRMETKPHVGLSRIVPLGFRVTLTSYSSRLEWLSSCQRALRGITALNGVTGKVVLTLRQFYLNVWKQTWPCRQSQPTWSPERDHGIFHSFHFLVLASTCHETKKTCFENAWQPKQPVLSLDKRACPLWPFLCCWMLDWLLTGKDTFAAVFSYCSQTRASGFPGFWPLPSLLLRHSKTVSELTGKWPQAAYARKAIAPASISPSWAGYPGLHRL